MTEDEKRSKPLDTKDPENDVSEPKETLSAEEALAEIIRFWDLQSNQSDRHQKATAGDSEARTMAPGQAGAPDGKDSSGNGGKDAVREGNKDSGTARIVDRDRLENITLKPEQLSKIDPALGAVMERYGIKHVSVFRENGKEMLVADSKEPIQIDMDPASGCRKVTIAGRLIAEVSRTNDGSITLGNIKGLSAEVDPGKDPVFGAPLPWVIADVEKIKISKGQDDNPPQVEVTGSWSGISKTLQVPLSKEHIQQLQEFLTKADDLRRPNGDPSFKLKYSKEELLDPAKTKVDQEDWADTLFSMLKVAVGATAIYGLVRGGQALVSRMADLVRSDRKGAPAGGDRNSGNAAEKKDGTGEGKPERLSPEFESFYTPERIDRMCRRLDEATKGWQDITKQAERAKPYFDAESELHQAIDARVKRLVEGGKDEESARKTAIEEAKNGPADSPLREKYEAALKLRAQYEPDIIAVEGRQRSLQQLIDRVCDLENIPRVKVEVVSDLGRSEGQYSQGEGRLRIRQQDVLNPEGGRRIADNIQHELTHHIQDTQVIKAIAQNLNTGYPPNQKELKAIQDEYRKLTAGELNGDFAKRLLEKRPAEPMTAAQLKHAEELGHGFARMSENQSNEKAFLRQRDAVEAHLQGMQASPSYAEALTRYLLKADPEMRKAILGENPPEGLIKSMDKVKAGTLNDKDAINLNRFMDVTLRRQLAHLDRELDNCHQIYLSNTHEAEAQEVSRRVVGWQKGHPTSAAAPGPMPVREVRDAKVSDTHRQALNEKLAADRPIGSSARRDLHPADRGRDSGPPRALDRGGSARDSSRGSERIPAADAATITKALEGLDNERGARDLALKLAVDFNRTLERKLFGEDGMPEKLKTLVEQQKKILHGKANAADWDEDAAKKAFKAELEPRKKDAAEPLSPAFHTAHRERSVEDLLRRFREASANWSDLSDHKEEIERYLDAKQKLSKAFEREGETLKDKCPADMAPREYAESLAREGKGNADLARRYSEVEALRPAAMDTVEARIRAFQSVCNDLAKAEGVPPWKVVGEHLASYGADGVYQHGRNTIELPFTNFLNARGTTELRKTLAHELVHREQDITIMRALGEKLKEADTAFDAKTPEGMRKLQETFKEKTGYVLDEKFARSVLDNAGDKKPTQDEIDRGIKLAESLTDFRRQVEPIEKRLAVIDEQLARISDSKNLTAFLDEMQRDKELCKKVFGADEIAGLDTILKWRRDGVATDEEICRALQDRMVEQARPLHKQWESIYDKVLHEKEAWHVTHLAEAITSAENVVAPEAKVGDPAAVAEEVNKALDKASANAVGRGDPDDPLHPDNKKLADTRKFYQDKVKDGTLTAEQAKQLLDPDRVDPADRDLVKVLIEAKKIQAKGVETLLKLSKEGIAAFMSQPRLQREAMMSLLDQGLIKQLGPDSPAQKRQLAELAKLCTEQASGKLRRPLDLVAKLLEMPGSAAWETAGLLRNQKLSDQQLQKIFGDASSIKDPAEQHSLILHHARLSSADSALHTRTMAVENQQLRNELVKAGSFGHLKEADIAQIETAYKASPEQAAVIERILKMQSATVDGVKLLNSVLQSGLNNTELSNLAKVLDAKLLKPDQLETLFKTSPEERSTVLELMAAGKVADPQLLSKLLKDNDSQALIKALKENTLDSASLSKFFEMTGDHADHVRAVLRAQADSKNPPMNATEMAGLLTDPQKAFEKALPLDTKYHNAADEVVQAQRQAFEYAQKLLPHLTDETKAELLKFVRETIPQRFQNNKDTNLPDKALLNLQIDHLRKVSTSLEGKTPEQIDLLVQRSLSGPLKMAAERAGVPEKLKGEEMVLFVHGTSKEQAQKYLKEHGKALSADGGNFGGKFFTTGDMNTAEFFARRKAGGDHQLLGVAIPKSVVDRLIREGKLRDDTLVLDNPTDLRENIFEKGAVAELKEHAVFFSLEPEAKPATTGTDVHYTAGDITKDVGRKGGPATDEGKALLRMLDPTGRRSFADVFKDMQRALGADEAAKLLDKAAGLVVDHGMKWSQVPAFLKTLGISTKGQPADLFKALQGANPKQMELSARLCSGDNAPLTGLNIGEFERFLNISGSKDSIASVLGKLEPAAAERMAEAFARSLKAGWDMKNSPDYQLPDETGGIYGQRKLGKAMLDTIKPGNKLYEDGWRVLAAGDQSLADRAGMDFVLVNVRTGKWLPLDVTQKTKSKEFYQRYSLGDRALFNEDKSVNPEGLTDMLGAYIDKHKDQVFDLKDVRPPDLKATASAEDRQRSQEEFRDALAEARRQLEERRSKLQPEQQEESDKLAQQLRDLAHLQDGCDLALDHLRKEGALNDHAADALGRFFKDNKDHFGAGDQPTATDPRDVDPAARAAAEEMVRVNRKGDVTCRIFLDKKTGAMLTPPVSGDYDTRDFHLGNVKQLVDKALENADLSPSEKAAIRQNIDKYKFGTDGKPMSPAERALLGQLMTVMREGLSTDTAGDGKVWSELAGITKKLVNEAERERLAQQGADNPVLSDHTRKALEHLNEDIYKRQFKITDKGVELAKEGGTKSLSDLLRDYHDAVSHGRDADAALKNVQEALKLCPELSTKLVDSLKTAKGEASGHLQKLLTEGKLGPALETALKKATVALDTTGTVQPGHPQVTLRDKDNNVINPEDIKGYDNGKRELIVNDGKTTRRVPIEQIKTEIKVAGTTDGVTLAREVLLGHVTALQEITRHHRSNSDATRMPADHLRAVDELTREKFAEQSRLVNDALLRGDVRLLAQELQKAWDREHPGTPFPNPYTGDTEDARFNMDLALESALKELATKGMPEERLSRLKDIAQRASREAQDPAQERPAMDVLFRDHASGTTAEDLLFHPSTALTKDQAQKFARELEKFGKNPLAEKAVMEEFLKFMLEKTRAWDADLKPDFARVKELGQKVLDAEATMKSLAKAEAQRKLGFDATTEAVDKLATKLLDGTEKAEENGRFAKQKSYYEGLRAEHSKANAKLNETTNARAAELQKAANDFCRKHGLPEIKINVVEHLSGGAATYTPGTGRVNLPRTALLSRAEGTQAANAVFHELIHVQQDQQIVRMLADKNGIKSGKPSESEASAAKSIQEEYKRITGRDLDLKFLDDVAKLRKGDKAEPEKLSETQTEKAKLLAEAFKHAQPFAQKDESLANAQRVAAAERAALRAPESSNAALDIVKRLADSSNTRLAEQLMGTSDRSQWPEPVRKLVEAYEKGTKDSSGMPAGWNEREARDILGRHLDSRQNEIDGERRANYEKYISTLAEKEAHLLGTDMNRLVRPEYIEALYNNPTGERPTADQLNVVPDHFKTADNVRALYDKLLKATVELKSGSAEELASGLRETAIEHLKAKGVDTKDMNRVYFGFDEHATEKKVERFVVKDGEPKAVTMRGGEFFLNGEKVDPGSVITRITLPKSFATGDPATLAKEACALLLEHGGNTIPDAKRGDLVRAYVDVSLKNHVPLPDTVKPAEGTAGLDSSAPPKPGAPEVVKIEMHPNGVRINGEDLSYDHIWKARVEEIKKELEKERAKTEGKDEEKIARLEKELAHEQSILDGINSKDPSVREAAVAKAEARIKEAIEKAKENERAGRESRISEMRGRAVALTMIVAFLATSVNKQAQAAPPKGRDKAPDKGNDAPAPQAAGAPDKPKDAAPNAPDKPKDAVPNVPDKPKDAAPNAPDKPKDAAANAPHKPKDAAPNAPDKPKDAAANGPDKPVEVVTPVDRTVETARLADMPNSERVQRTIVALLPAINEKIKRENERALEIDSKAKPKPPINVAQLQSEWEQGIFGPESRKAWAASAEYIQKEAVRFMQVMDARGMEFPPGAPLGPGMSASGSGLREGDELFRARLRNGSVQFSFGMSALESGKLPTGDEITRFLNASGWMGQAGVKMRDEVIKGQASYLQYQLDHLNTVNGLEGWKPPKDANTDQLEKWSYAVAPWLQTANQVERYANTLATINAALTVRGLDFPSLNNLISSLPSGFGKLPEEALRSPKFPGKVELNDDGTVKKITLDMPESLDRSSPANREKMEKLEKWLAEYGPKVDSALKAVGETMGKDGNFLMYAEDDAIPSGSKAPNGQEYNFKRHTFSVENCDKDGKPNPNGEYRRVTSHQDYMWARWYAYNNWDFAGSMQQVQRVSGEPKIYHKNDYIAIVDEGRMKLAQVDKLNEWASDRERNKQIGNFANLAVDVGMLVTGTLEGKAAWSAAKKGGEIAMKECIKTALKAGWHVGLGLTGLGKRAIENWFGDAGKQFNHWRHLALIADMSFQLTPKNFQKGVWGSIWGETKGVGALEKYMSTVAKEGGWFSKTLKAMHTAYDGGKLPHIGVFALCDYYFLGQFTDTAKMLVGGKQNTGDAMSAILKHGDRYRPMEKPIHLEDGKADPEQLRQASQPLLNTYSSYLRPPMAEPNARSEALRRATDDALKLPEEAALRQQLQQKLIDEYKNAKTRAEKIAAADGLLKLSEGKDETQEFQPTNGDTTARFTRRQLLDFIDGCPEKLAPKTQEMLAKPPGDEAREAYKQKLVDLYLRAPDYNTRVEAAKGLVLLSKKADGTLPDVLAKMERDGIETTLHTRNVQSFLERTGEGLTQRAKELMFLPDSDPRKKEFVTQVVETYKTASRQEDRTAAAILLLAMRKTNSLDEKIGTAPRQVALKEAVDYLKLMTDKADNPLVKLAAGDMLLRTNKTAKTDLDDLKKSADDAEARSKAKPDDEALKTAAKAARDKATALETFQKGLKFDYVDMAAVCMSIVRSDSASSEAKAQAMVSTTGPRLDLILDIMRTQVEPGAALLKDRDRVMEMANLYGRDSKAIEDMLRQVAGNESENPDIRALAMQVVSANGAGRLTINGKPLSPGETATLGTEGNYKLTGEGIEKRHAALAINQDGQLMIRDLGSGKGTWIVHPDGKSEKVGTGWKAIQPGDKIILGDKDSGQEVKLGSEQAAAFLRMRENLEKSKKAGDLSENYYKALRDALSKDASPTAMPNAAERNEAHIAKYRAALAALDIGPSVVGGDVVKFRALVAAGLADAVHANQPELAIGALNKLTPELVASLPPKELDTLRSSCLNALTSSSMDAKTIALKTAVLQKAELLFANAPREQRDKLCQLLECSLLPGKSEALLKTNFTARFPAYRSSTPELRQSALEALSVFSPERAATVAAALLIGGQVDGKQIPKDVSTVRFKAVEVLDKLQPLDLQKTALAALRTETDPAVLARLWNTEYHSRRPDFDSIATLREINLLKKRIQDRAVPGLFDGGKARWEQNQQDNRNNRNFDQYNKKLYDEAEGKTVPLQSDAAKAARLAMLYDISQSQLGSSMARELKEICQKHGPALAKELAPALEMLLQSYPSMPGYARTELMEAYMALKPGENGVVTKEEAAIVMMQVLQNELSKTPKERGGYDSAPYLNAESVQTLALKYIEQCATDKVVPMLESLAKGPGACVFDNQGRPSKINFGTKSYEVTYGNETDAVVSLKDTSSGKTYTRKGAEAIWESTDGEKLYDVKIALKQKRGDWETTETGTIEYRDAKGVNHTWKPNGSHLERSNTEDGEKTRVTYPDGKNWLEAVRSKEGDKQIITVRRSNTDKVDVWESEGDSKPFKLRDGKGGFVQGTVASSIGSLYSGKLFSSGVYAYSLAADDYKTSFKSTFIEIGDTGRETRTYSQPSQTRGVHTHRTEQVFAGYGDPTMHPIPEVRALANKALSSYRDTTRLPRLAAENDLMYYEHMSKRDKEYVPPFGKSVDSSKMADELAKVLGDPNADASKVCKTIFAACLCKPFEANDPRLKILNVALKDGSDQVRLAAVQMLLESKQPQDRERAIFCLADLAKNTASPALRSEAQAIADKMKKEGSAEDKRVLARAMEETPQQLRKEQAKRDAAELSPNKDVQYQRAFEKIKADIVKGAQRATELRNFDWDAFMHKHDLNLLTERGLSQAQHEAVMQLIRNRGDLTSIFQSDKSKKAEEDQARENVKQGIPAQWTRLIGLAMSLGEDDPDGKECRNLLVYTVLSNGDAFFDKDRKEQSVNKAIEGIHAICTGNSPGKGDMDWAVATLLTQKPDLSHEHKQKLLSALDHLVIPNGKMNHETAAKIVMTAFEQESRIMPAPGSPGYDASVQRQKALLERLQKWGNRELEPVLKYLAAEHKSAEVREAAGKIKFPDNVAEQQAKQMVADVAGSGKFPPIKEGTDGRVAFILAAMNDSKTPAQQRLRAAQILTAPENSGVKDVDKRAALAVLTTLGLQNTDDKVKLKTAQTILAERSLANAEQKNKAVEVMVTLALKGDPDLAQSARDGITRLSGEQQTLAARTIVQAVADGAAAKDKALPLLTANKPLAKAALDAAQADFARYENLRTRPAADKMAAELSLVPALYAQVKDDPAAEAALYRIYPCLKGTVGESDTTARQILGLLDRSKSNEGFLPILSDKDPRIAAMLSALSCDNADLKMNAALALTAKDATGVSAEAKTQARNVLAQKLTSLTSAAKDAEREGKNDKDIGKLWAKVEDLYKRIDPDGETRNTFAFQYAMMKRMAGELGPNHQSLIPVYTKLAELAEAGQDQAQARLFRKKAQDAGGPASPGDAGGADNQKAPTPALAQRLADARKASADAIAANDPVKLLAAERELKAVEALARQQLGGNNPNVAAVLTQLGKQYMVTGQTIQGEAAYKQAISIYEANGKDKAPPESAETMLGLARYYATSGNLGAYQEYKGKLLDRSRMRTKEGPLASTQALMDLADFLTTDASTQTMQMEAKQILEDAQQARKTAYGENSVEYADTTVRLADFYANSNNQLANGREAQRLLRSATATYARAQGGTNNERWGQAQAKLASVCIAGGEYKTGIQSYNAALDALHNSPGVNAARYREIVTAYANTLAHIGKFDEANALRADPRSFRAMQQAQGEPIIQNLPPAFDR